MLEVKNISKSYGDLLAVDDLSFIVKPGEVFGLLGANGSGKTTTFRIIMGLLDADKGHVTLDGKPVDYNVTDKIGFVTEERSLLLKLTVYEQMIFYGVLKSMNEEEIEKKLDYWLERFQISDYKHRKIKELSKGNQQKIQFISAILNEPELLVLDEPFSGLDPINVLLFNDAIKELSKNGCMIIFSSHQMEFIEQFCEKMMILVNGKSVIDGNIKQIKKDFAKKNITISGNFKKEIFANIKGITNVQKNPFEYIVQVENEDVISKIFKAISKYEVTKFLVEEPSINDIFIEKVGEAYE